MHAFLQALHAAPTLFINLLFSNVIGMLRLRLIINKSSKCAVGEKGRHKKARLKRVGLQREE